MSKHNKTYGKRGPSAPIASIQFDKVITDSTKRPSASKSAGVVGKWGTTSFTSLRSSQVNGSKAGKAKKFSNSLEPDNKKTFIILILIAKKGVSPVKCLPGDYGASNLITTPAVLSSGNDAFSFEAGINSATVSAAPLQPKPRKFFKSRGSDDLAKGAASSQNASVNSNAYTDYPTRQTDNVGSENLNLYASTAGNVGYISPTYSSPANKASGKRGRGRPRGSRSSASPRRSTTGVVPKPASTRGTSRGKRRNKTNRSVRGQHGAGRAKRKRAQWEESESEEEEEAASSEMEEPEEELGEAVENEPVDEENDNDEEEEETWEHNGAERYPEEDKPKPPIKLIIRRNDAAAFVSKVESQSGQQEQEQEQEQETPSPTGVAPREEVCEPMVDNGLVEPQPIAREPSPLLDTGSIAANTSPETRPVVEVR